MKTLGLDLGTNSIGWAVVDTSMKEPLVAKGVQIFEKGVGEEKNNEFSLASKRTVYRSARRRKQRRKLRKFHTLKVLVDAGYCPGLKLDDLEAWMEKKIYPSNLEFREWLNTKAETATQKPIDPYTIRAKVAKGKLDLTRPENRYLLGRAFYHMAQRRGYKSNRVSGDEKDGAVAGSIQKLDKERDGRTLGQLFKEEYFGRKRIRGQYTAREQYLDEFRRICETQALDKQFVADLEKAIFLQRPLKSQKGTVGPCLLEKGKARVPVSHPDFERFRALQLINNIRVVAPGEAEFRPLTSDERQKALEWNLTRVKNEKFSSLAKQITPKRAKRVFGIKSPEEDAYTWQFNFREDAVVSDCSVNSRLSKLFGSDWKENLPQRYLKAKNKSVNQIVDDVWHAMFNFDDAEKLKNFAIENLALTEEDAKAFAKPLRQGYGSLSLAATRKILPWLEQGLIYSHAVFVANLPTLFAKQGLDWQGNEARMGEDIQKILEGAPRYAARKSAVREALMQLVAAENTVDPDTLAMPNVRKPILKTLEKQIRLRLGTETWDSWPSEERNNRLNELFGEVRGTYHVDLKPEDVPKIPTVKDRIKEMLVDDYGFQEKYLRNIYHPAAMEAFPKTNGKLGSPRVPSIKNPVFMRTMHRLRAVVNELIEKGVVDSDTRVRVEMARDLTTANDRKAIYRFQKEREKENATFRAEIEELGFPVPSEKDPRILKYRLWKEQEEKCPYTGEQICASSFLSDNPTFDFEHTIPQSRRFDDSQSNLTLSDRDYNRRVKGNRMPSELADHGEILARVKSWWEPRVEFHEAGCAKARSASRSAGDKDSKDRARQSLHYHQQHLRYWRDKLRNFEAKEVPEGFTNRQLVDTRIITKYAVQYLKSGFNQVYSLKASALTSLKEIWGLQEKHRDNHIHHCVDAIIAAVVSPRFYDELAAYYHEHERWLKTEASKPRAPEPWPGFARYLNEQIIQEVLVVHHHRDLLLKQTHRILRKRGKIQRNPDGSPIHVRGDSARGSLHQETNYAKIREVPTKENAEPDELFTVVRKALESLKPDEIGKIVDPVVREKVKEQKDKIGKETVWFNREKNIPIRHVRVRCKNDPKSLITLKPHRDVSKAGHKRHLYVANDNNHLLAVYKGTVNGVPRGTVKLVSSIQAVRAHKEGVLSDILPEKDEKGYILRHVLKTGTQVLFYKENPDELRTLARGDLSRRLYRVTVMESSRVKFNHHMTSLTSGELGNGSSKIHWDQPFPDARLYLTFSKNDFVVEGTDFTLTNTGEIEWRF